MTDDLRARIAELERENAGLKAVIATTTDALELTLEKWRGYAKVAGMGIVSTNRAKLAALQGSGE